MSMGYGSFCGGDPRKFFPDGECSTEKERAAHAFDCERWDAWEAAGYAGEPPKPSVRYGHEPIVNAEGEAVGHVTFAGYGLGAYEYDDEDFDIEPPTCDSSPTCPCDCCTAEREAADEAALARHREATSSAAVPQEKNDNG